MGFYINPPDCSKEEFLQQNGVRIAEELALTHDFSGPSLPVCLVDNGPFTAAGIGYDQTEVARFIRGMNGRTHQWFTVDKTKLEPYLEGRL